MTNVHTHTHTHTHTHRNSKVRKRTVPWETYELSMEFNLSVYGSISCLSFGATWVNIHTSVPPCAYVPGQNFSHPCPRKINVLSLSDEASKIFPMNFCEKLRGLFRAISHI